MADKLILVAMPTVISLLVRREHDLGRELTEAEVLEVRDGAQCIALPVASAQEVARNRGYEDLNLERVWESWQEYCRQFPRLDRTENDGPTSTPATG